MVRSLMGNEPPSEYRIARCRPVPTGFCYRRGRKPKNTHPHARVVRSAGGKNMKRRFFVVIPHTATCTQIRVCGCCRSTAGARCVCHMCLPAERTTLGGAQAPTHSILRLAPAGAYWWGPAAPRRMKNTTYSKNLDNFCPPAGQSCVLPVGQFTNQIVTTSSVFHARSASMGGCILHRG
jgi:hypothetical protein